MLKNATVRARIEPELKESVERLFKKLGITTSEAINIFFTQVKLRNGLPFNVVVPNKTTEKVLNDTDIGKNLVHCENADDIFEKLRI